MEFAYRYLYLITGLMLSFASAVRLFILLKSVNADGQESLGKPVNRSEITTEIELIILLTGLILGGILLRQAYVMFTGISRSAIF